MNIVFAGTPEFAAVHLKAIIEHGFTVKGVFTQPDRPSGRGHKIVQEPVKKVALEAGIPVFQPESFKNNPNALADLKNLHPDLFVVVAYGLILTDEVLNTPKYGCINVHGSILPRWRGAAPIQRSLWAGDKNTGITIMKISPKLDSGDIIKTVSLPITDSDTSGSLYEKLSQKGSLSLIEVLNDIPKILDTAVAQDESLVTYAKKITKEEAEINWNEDAAVIERKIRAYQPWPSAWFMLNNEHVKVINATCTDTTSDKEAGTILSSDKNGIAVATGNGIVVLKIIQISGRRAMEVKDVLNSRKNLFPVGTILVNSHE